MIDPNDPNTRSVLDFQWATYLWVFALSTWGGLVSFVQKVRAGAARPFNFVELVGEMVVSAFVGVITFWLGTAAGLPPLVVAAMVGISSHMGTRALFQLEQLVAKKLLPGTAP